MLLICFNTNFFQLSRFTMFVIMIYRNFVLIFTLGFISIASAQFIYLNTGVFKFIAGIGLPINEISMPGGSLSWFQNFQVFYKLPDNVTYFEPYKVLQKRSLKNTFNRPNIYQAFVKFFSRLGFTGNKCIQRIICEVASGKVNQEENGLLGDIIHILFSPGSDFQRGLEVHREAQRIGLHNDSDCEVVYGDCYVKGNPLVLV